MVAASFTSTALTPTLSAPRTARIVEVTEKGSVAGTALVIPRCWGTVCCRLTGGTVTASKNSGSHCRPMQNAGLALVVGQGVLRERTHAKGMGEGGSRYPWLIGLTACARPRYVRLDTTHGPLNIELHCDLVGSCSRRLEPL